ncbi:Dethiobiotin synthase protein [Dioscorea alata]|uniref:Dethiobiotin synthase protein n=1 Tax=Dioscorea alata TaxID=55571 RepID=A0ACB7VDJ3_DIOAL|nr:Dethiobiotin synthase protein [Dioscorea alata]
MASLLFRHRSSPASSLRLLRLLLQRPISSSSASLDVDISHPTYIVWGANTGVGKTLVSAGLAFSVISRSPSSFLYLKPLQTGFPIDSDSRFLVSKITSLFRSASPPFPLLASHHALRASLPAARALPGFNEQSDSTCCFEETKIGGGDGEEVGARLVCKTLYAWNEPISPHLAVEREGMAIGDSDLREMLHRCLAFGGVNDLGKETSVWRVIETAGGVASPGPSGTLQCDLYRPLRFPAVLIGDGRLGGISTTISAYECLKLRGYDVAAIVLVDQGLANEAALLSYLRNRVHVFVLPPIPHDPLDDLKDWFCESGNVFDSLKETLIFAHSKRIERLQDMPRKAGDIFWWPFTQHQLVPLETVTVIDSRCGENFAVHKVCDKLDMIVPQFDACASWWTQGPDATFQIELARDMGYSAARYGHVMFPENVYEPALRCAELLLEGVGEGWASRAYYSDNGSTAVEIALKMAFRKFSFDHGIAVDSDNGIVDRCYDFKVLALSGSYHGDTLGAMEAQAPSSYTSFHQQPWYSGRGLFLDPPMIFISDGVWNLSFPDAFLSHQPKDEKIRFHLRDELFCQTRDCSALAKCYSAYISRQLSQFFDNCPSTYIAALIIEPVVQGAGGMQMIDPLFQRTLVRECRARRIPVIFDEVFTGFWRLGRESAAELLGCSPDVACFAKLMTGGVLPLAVTLTTEAVFEVFKGGSKLMALLHGHSYSAHAMGCTAASKAIQWFKDPCTNINIEPEGRKMKELWDMQLVLQLSSLNGVSRVIAIGTLCAIELRASGSDVGYASLYASSLVQLLRKDGIYMRPLGNVLYLMCGPCTSPDICNQHLRNVYQRISEFQQSSDKGIR